MPNINTAYNFVIDKCNDPDVGYHQSYRNEQTVSGITYYDCSSLMWYGLKAGGFDVVGAYEEVCWGYEGNAIVTDYLCNWLLTLGFTEINISDEWLPGDILWRDGHTEMVYSGRTTMGAHGREGRELEDQVSINSEPSSVSSWSRCFRYGGGASGEPDEPQVFEWIYGENNEYLTESQMQNNAVCVYQFFSEKGWSINAIAGLLGNLEIESTLNPNMIEIGGTGHGLVQWTPPENLYTVLDVLYGSHSDWYLGEKQCSVIYAEYEEATGQADRGIEKQWYQTDSYSISWGDWATSELSPGYLALAFMYNYERPNMDNGGKAEERSAAAQKWYEYLLAGDFESGGGGTTPTPDPETPTIKKKKHYKFYLFQKRKRGYYA